MSSSVTAEEMKRRCPLIWVECLGERVLARTSCRADKALLTITDTDLLARIEGDGTFVVEWQDIANAMNTSSPIFVSCQERKKS